MSLKRIFMLAAFLVIFLIANSNALDTDMKKIYAPGETIIAEITGPILEPISTDNVQFKRDENIAVPFEYDLKKIDEKYYLWAISPETSGNYTLILKDVMTLNLGKNQKMDLFYNFSVEGNITAYSVKPGFIITSKDVELKARLNRDYALNILIGNGSRFITLAPGENKITLSLNELRENANGLFRFGAYFLPFKIIGENPEETPVQEGLLFSPSIIRRNVNRTIDKLDYQIEIQNAMGYEIKNIYFAYDSSKFKISPDAPFSLKPNESRDYNLTVFNLSNFREYEEIYARSNDSYARLLLNIASSDDSILSNATENGSRVDNQSNEGYRCSEIRGGRFCNTGEKCSGESVESLDGECCVGTCAASAKPQSSSWIGYVLAVILLGIIGYVYYNYSKTKKNKDDSFKKKVDEAEKSLP